MSFKKAAISNLSRWRSSLRRRMGLLQEADFFLNKVRGVVHVGANEGTEAGLYARLGLNVLWFEPIPHVYQKLVRNIAQFKEQIAVNSLLADYPDQKLTLKISNNSGLSSSIFDLKGHREIWPSVEFISMVELVSDSIDAYFSRNNGSAERYDALVLDTQGSELLVLKGAENSLRNFRYIKAEAADFEAYEGGVTATELIDWLDRHGFEPRLKQVIRYRAGVGSYYDITFERKS